MARRGQGGWNLLEWLVALAIAGMTLSLGVPALSRLLHAQQLRQQTQALYQTVRLAREEALRRQQPVYLCPANLKINLQLQGCQPAAKAGNWSEGALAYADIGAAGKAAYDSGERLGLAIFRQPLAVSGSRPQLVFTADGRLLPAAPAHFLFRHPPSGLCQELRVGAGGRPWLEAVRDGCA
nr:GspH/FimT family pseudopilin [Chromobacterium sp. ASV5]